MTNPTQLPVPSTSPLDLLFNAEKIDEAVNSAALTYLDRFGVSRKTVAGAVNEIALVNVRGAWAAATLYSVKDVVLQAGTWYFCVQVHTSAGSFATDLPTKWRVYQGVVGPDLSNATDATKGPGLVGFNGTLNYTVSTIGWADKLNAVKPEWWIAAGLTQAAALQAAIDNACTARRSVVLNERYTTATTLTMPTSSNGCTIYGATRSSGITYTGASTLFSATSTRSFNLENLTLIGPGSIATAATAVTCAPASPSVGTFYNGFRRLTIEGFRTGMDVSGLVCATFEDINIGLSKSGYFAGTDQDASPLIGIKIGTTVLDCQFRGITIFAKQRCVQQITGAQLVEGLYFDSCTFDLSYNDGQNINQSCVYFESGQDVTFDSCWFTNTQKYAGGTAPYTDALIRVTHNPGAISAPLVSLKFSNCTGVGNGVYLDYGSSPLLTSELEFVGNVFRLYVNLGIWSIAGQVSGVNLAGNQIRVIGDLVNIAGTDYYNLVGRPFEMTSVKGFRVDGMTITSALPLNTVASFMRLTNCSQGTVGPYHVPPQIGLTSGNDVVLSGTSTDVVVIGMQQTAGRQIVTNIANGTYNTGSPTVVSYNTGLTKARMATVSVYIDLAQITNPGGTTMLFEIAGVNATDRFRRVLAAGNASLEYHCTGLVMGTVSLLVSSSLQMVIDATAIHRYLKVTYL